MELRLCNKCKEEKPLTEFQKDCSSKDGIRCRCRSCNSADMMRWAQANPERNKLNKARFSKSEKKKEYDRQRYKQAYFSSESVAVREGKKKELEEKKAARQLYIQSEEYKQLQREGYKKRYRENKEYYQLKMRNYHASEKGKQKQREAFKRWYDKNKRIQQSA